ncbi:hypothetical protein J7W16_16895 [Bacillus sp. YZJH907-2]|uniref:Uncharacterized protein n=1 Tax=Halalkalibacter suaedae TaxID=2822140 RepID=A0A940WV17_9BACI|nr:hypothetical protein [Bacillus suaedae]
MKGFFRNASKVSRLSLILTIVVTFVLLTLPYLAGYEARFVHVIGRTVYAVGLPFLVLNPLLGFIYSFFINEKIKIVYILVHLVFICTISLFAFVVIMFRYFVPFAP